MGNFTYQRQKDYLPSLQEKRFLKVPSSADDKSRKVQIGDIAILKGEGIGRGLWKLGKVTETLIRRQICKD